jgi:hypothetical protein
VGLTYCADTSAATWIAQSQTPPEQLIFFGPAGYNAYARLRFIPDPRRPGQAEADVTIPDDHPCEISQARRVLHLLSRFTATPQQCYFCLWEGYSDIALPAWVRRGALVAMPHRRYALLHGSLADIDGWERDLDVDGPCPPPAFAWPADRSWCFASDVDPHWAGIGAGRVAIDALVHDPDIDVVPARPTEVPPAYC